MRAPRSIETVFNFIKCWRNAEESRERVPFDDCGVIHSELIELPNTPLGQTDTDTLGAHTHTLTSVFAEGDFSHVLPPNITRTHLLV